MQAEEVRASTRWARLPGVAKAELVIILVLVLLGSGLLFAPNDAYRPDRRPRQAGCGADGGNLHAMHPPKARMVWPPSNGGLAGHERAASYPLHPPAVKSGAYVGGIAVDGVARFGQWRGRPLEVVADFLPGGSWSDIEMPEWWSWHWNQLANRPQMVVGVPLLPTDADTLADGAGGAYNAHFRTLAERMVANNLGGSVLRLGYEMNGNWFRYSAVGKEASFIDYWRQIVTTMRAVPGAHFDFNFNPTLGSGSWNARPDAMYPGDAYVDSIGLDVYDAAYGQSTLTPAQRWSSVKDGTYALDWWASFAAAHGGKPLSFPEWGTVAAADQNGGGGGDNPYFVKSFLTWVGAHHVSFESYFEVFAQDGDHYLEGTTFPNAAHVYRIGSRSL